MGKHMDVLIDAALETFELQHPIYQFGYCGGGHSAESVAGGGVPVGAGSVGHNLDSGGTTKRLEDLYRLPFADGTARSVICAGALEHVFEPRRAAGEMIRILAPGGILLLAASSDGLQGQPPDHYWHLTPNSVGRLLGGLEATLIGWQGADQLPHTVFGIGCKPPVSERFLHGTGAFTDRVQTLIEEAARRARGWPRLLGRLLGRVQDSSARHWGKDRWSVRFVVHLPLSQRLAHHLPSDQPNDNKTGTRLDLEN